MRPFEYTSPSALAQATELLGPHWDNAEILAGGTDLLALMKDDVVHPKRLVNIKQIADMRGVRFSAAGGLRVGALTTLQEFADNADVFRHYPVLATAAGDAASPQIRNMATMGGNLCQRPRCWYFRNRCGLLPKTPEGKSLVLEGDNRYHAILGNGPAYFVSPSSVAPALIAYGARVRISGPKGAREAPLEKFFVIPRSETEREHDLAANEVLTEILLPAPLAGARAGHYEVRQKEAFDWPLATASVVLTMSGNSVQSARVVLGHVAPVPWVSGEAAQALAGKMLNEQSAQAAADAAVSKAKGLGRNNYKIQLARVAVKRAILAAAKGGPDAYRI
jgi:xanthine dehydrogenase YagS FAD-binding subunit